MTTHETLPYRFEFDKNEVPHIVECNEQHGFAIVKGMLPGAMVEMLKAEVRRVLEPVVQSSGVITYTHNHFIEFSPVYASLMTYEPYMRIARALNGDEPISLNRSAAIYKKAGCGPMAWHTDWGPLEHPYDTNAVLNNSGASSMWFYLNGIDDVRGGLAIIPDSHTEDWDAPEGFAFTERKKSFYKKGAAPTPHTRMDDVPGSMPVVAEPGDMILFAERTYHGVYPHRGTETRLSCGMSFRKQSYKPEQVWPLSDSAKRFIDFCPSEIKPFVEGYIGMGGDWTSVPR
ncbi:phytanoyl-CoA dioxygenase family protein [Paenibacillus mesophilus]|uniref:phytanoyl-CoA dioxygenase family protein n=1 Tax=Paenibacillus mesophilus TaxID=2582849 RepID=UPI00110EFD71|nr:phytanoyl-CoA dioxygenase family protein [Paenibacillus mesophilus]TMV48707.1 phytanoyl-CoA dioxygenase family protein [Paenibacillus mesophilus]